jgi:ferritin-like metal-binding protein YciE
MSTKPKTSSAPSLAPEKQSDLHELLVAQLEDILWAESQLLKAIPKMATAAKSPVLKKALKDHLDETKGQVKRLDAIFSKLGLKPKAVKCEAMAGLLKEGDEIVEEFGKTSACDAAIIAAAQKVEHYEIATYGTLRAFAFTLGLQEVVKLLTETIEEEGMADRKLTGIAEQMATSLS